MTTRRTLAAAFLLVTLALCSCGSAQTRSTTSKIPVVPHPSAKLAHQLDAICAGAVASIDRWNETPGHSLTTFADLFRVEAQDVAELRAPATEQAALGLFKAGERTIADTYALLTNPTQADPTAVLREIVDRARRPAGRIAHLAHEMQAYTCERQALASAH